MSYLFLQPGSGSNNMVLDSKALKCRKKYTCLWKLCKWIVYYVCPCKYYKKKSARCTQSVSRVQESHTGRLGKEGTNKGACFSFLLSPAGKEQKKGGTWFSLEQVRPALLNKTIVGMEFILRVFLFLVFLDLSWKNIQNYTGLELMKILFFCGK